MSLYSTVLNTETKGEKWKEERKEIRRDKRKNEREANEGREERGNICKKRKIN